MHALEETFGARSEPPNTIATTSMVKYAGLTHILVHGLRRASPRSIPGAHVLGRKIPLIVLNYVIGFDKTVVTQIALSLQPLTRRKTLAAIHV